MSEFEQARSFGLIDCPHGLMCFDAYIDRYNSRRVSTPGYPIRAMWQGNQVIVEMRGGEKIVYSALSSQSYYVVSI